MRRIQSCTFAYAVHETTRQDQLIHPPQETASGAFTAVTLENGDVQSAETPEGYALRNVAALGDLKPGSHFNLDDEGARVVLLVSREGDWTVTRTLPR